MLTLDAQRAYYASELLAHTANIICAVRDEGPDAIVSAVFNALSLAPPPGTDPVVALVTVLAAQVPPDTSQEELVGWTRPFGEPQRVVLTEVDDALIRAVHMLTTGRAEASSVSAAARAEAVRQLDAQGYTTDEIAARIGMSKRGVRTLKAAQASPVAA